MNDKMRNLLVRSASGVVLFGVVCGAAFLGYEGFAALMMLIGVVGVNELYNLARAKGVAPQRGLGIVASLMLMLAAYCFGTLYVYQSDTMLVYSVSALITFVILMALMFVYEVFRRCENPLLNIATTTLGVMYVALPLSLMAAVPLLLAGNEVWSPWVFLCYLFLVWGNDVFAYLFGITFGRHKMCERLSPKKSWEGFFGGVAGSLAMGALGAYITSGGYIVWIGLAVVVSLSSVVGDLVESMFKRDAGVKDSGSFIPGHGGILDRFDALILSAPFAFIYLLMVRMML